MPKTTATVTVRRHKDWYEDETLFENGPRSGETVWRLDFAVGENAFQAQMFGRVALTEAQFDRLKAKDPVPYKSFRLFIERDNRLEGEPHRWDYACKAWRLTKDEALALLRMGERGAVKAMKDKVAAVAALPNDREFIASDWRDSEYDRKEKAAVTAYWAKLDAQK